MAIAAPGNGRRRRDAAADGAIAGPAGGEKVDIEAPRGRAEWTPTTVDPSPGGRMSSVSRVDRDVLPAGRPGNPVQARPTPTTLRAWLARDAYSWHRSWSRPARSGFSGPFCSRCCTRAV